MEVPGFLAGAAHAGIKYEGRLDLGVIFSNSLCTTAAVFTSNLVKAAPVIDSMNVLMESEGIRALVVNSGNANACTGDKGLEDCMAIRQKAAELLDCNSNEVLVASTGVIGTFLPMERYMKGIEDACSSMDAMGLLKVSEAILTTDTRPKVAMREVESRAGTIKIFGMAKGAGMIAPKLGPPQATMLAFILTDAVVEGAYLQEMVQEGVDVSFNRITIDGDTSTNDTVLVLANGNARNQVIDGYEKPSKEFKDALFSILKSLSEQIVLDGEGATKCVKVCVFGAANQEEARLCAEAICNSPLVKTAFFGQDPNWGRIMAAAGRSGACFSPEKVEIRVGDVVLVKDGLSVGSEAEKEAKKVMEGNRFEVVIDLGKGNGEFFMLTCDLSTEYVHINADYRT